MRSISAVDAAENLSPYPPRLLMFHTHASESGWLPLDDGHVFKSANKAIQEGKMHEDVEYMIGFNTHEGSLFVYLSFLLYKDISASFYESIVKSSFPSFYKDVLQKYPAAPVPHDRLVELITDAYFLQFVKLFARSASDKGRKVYMYEYSRSPIVSALGFIGLNATHAEEVNSIFRNRPFIIEEDDQLSITMRNCWTSFVHTGNPIEWWNSLEKKNPSFTWPVFEKPHYYSIDLNVNITLDEDVREDYVSFWRSKFPQGLVFLAEQSWFDEEPMLSYLMNVGVLRTIIRIKRSILLVSSSILLVTLVLIYKCCCITRKHGKAAQDTKKKQ